MSLVIEIRTRTLSARTTLHAGQSMTVGCDPRADVSLPTDAQLAPLHLVLQAGEQACTVRDVSGGISMMVDGRTASEATAHHGSIVVVGETQLVVRGSAEAPMFEGAPVVTSLEPSMNATSFRCVDEQARQAWLVGMLRRERPIFALLDAARDPAVLECLRRGGEEYWSLLSGEPAERMANSAPYLVRFSTDNALSTTLVERGWGQSWGVYLASRSSPESVVAALQDLLIARDDDGGTMYFRFFDPRVLRTFLPMATPLQAEYLFAAVDAFLLEGPSHVRHGSALLRFSRLGSYDSSTRPQA